jgi:hypothetical protein
VSRSRYTFASLSAGFARALVVVSLVACTPVYTASDGIPTQQRAAWPVITRSHVDLWLHGYAMLLRDTATVPVFRRGYRDRIRAEKSQRSITTQLDANRERLQSRFALSPNLVNGQFLPLYFATWEQMTRVIDLFVRADGNPQATGDRAIEQYFAVLSQSFQTAADREWLKTFTESLEDERRKFYQEYWNREHGARIAHVRDVDSMWTKSYRQRFARYLNNTQQEAGDFVLALTLGGEGRTVNFSARQNAVASTLPDSSPTEAFYVFAHEVTSPIVVQAVTDNTTPSEQRAGISSRHITAGAVRAGAILLHRIAPELADGYARYYLMQANQPTTGDVNARLATVFPLPDMIFRAIERQLDVVLGGI